MNYLSLFSGVGCGDLAHQKITGEKCRGYVEYEPYCQEIIKQRIADGILDTAPIFGDIRRFNSEGYAESYKGMVDGIFGGFPCQPFSVAGKQRGEFDPRNMWPATIETIRIVRPEYVFLENVPKLISHTYFGTIAKDLSESGFCFRWCLLGASDIEAPHKRKRLWILAHSTSIRSESWRAECERQFRRFSSFRASCSWFEEDPADISDCFDGRCEDRRAKGYEQNVYGTNENIRPAIAEFCRGHASKWGIKSRLGRVAHGIANRVDRIKALGNGQVPFVEALAWAYLTGEFYD
jgi:DNA (cytosine-5)-methyltransferase 1